MPLPFKLPHPGGPAYDPAVVGQFGKAAAKLYVPKPPPKHMPPPPMADMDDFGGGTPGHELRDVIPELFDFKVPCPQSLGNCEIAGEPRTLFDLIQHLNDRHTWTREAIADWLDSLDVDLTFKAKGGDHDGDEDPRHEGGGVGGPVGDPGP